MTKERDGKIGLDCWPLGVRKLLQARHGEHGEVISVALEWFFGEGCRHAEVQKYTAYLKRMGEAFQATAELFDLWSPISGDTKKSLRLTKPEEQLYIANHLYLLNSEAVPGVVLECGCAHGFSSACLSIACAALGRKLVIADSFEGLPDVRPDEPFFRKGDYAAAEANVLHHVGVCGDVSVVRTVKGWYRESLNAWNEPIALLWMDVDLYESATDLLKHVVSSIEPKGAIFTHEFTDFNGRLQPIDGRNVPAAIRAAFEDAGYVYRSELICRYWGIICGDRGVGIGSHALLDVLWDRLRRMDPRWRQHEELLQSRTVRTAFALKRVMTPWRK